MRNLSIAVVGILASAAASAATHDLYIGGASAQSAFWKADFGTSVCAPNAVTTYTIANTGGAAPANEAWRCTAGVATVAGIAVGDTVTVHYNSELGTISGVAPLVYNNAIAARLFVNPDSADCVGTVCTISSYSNQTETFTSTNGTALQPMPARAGQTFHQFDIGAADVEIKHWSKTQNWTDATFNTAMGTLPSVAQLATAATGGTVMNGQVFSVIANNTGPLQTIGNISQSSLRAIFTGKYNVWGDVPEVGANNATPIVLCRREYGSGTQVSMSIFITGNECGASGNAIASIASPGALTGGGSSVVENASTGAVRTCVQNNAGGIGVASLSVSANYLTLNVDGVQANAHNAGNGFYQFAMESWVYNKSAVSGATTAMQNLATRLISNARTVAGLTSQIEGTAVPTGNGQYSATTRRSNFALPIGGTGNTPPTVAKAASLTAAVIALQTKNGDNCKQWNNANTL